MANKDSINESLTQLLAPMTDGPLVRVVETAPRENQSRFYLNGSRTDPLSEVFDVIGEAVQRVIIHHFSKRYSLLLEYIERDFSRRINCTTRGLCKITH